MTEEPGERAAADTPYTTELDTLISKAHTASEAETMLQRVKMENQVVADACEAVRELSEAGDLSETQMNGLAENLSRLLEQYTKTDLKTEFREYFGERSGEPFDEIIETRLETVKIIANTDAKQGSVFRWHFSDGVKLETETSDEGSRLHYSWNHFRDLYFDALLAENRGEAIADPTPERRGGEEWRDWISDVILDHSETVEHVGPRTEAVRQLRDYISRSVGYTDLAKVSERAGIGIDVDDATQTVADLDADTQLFVPREQITRVCEQTGISSRALQIELDAREVTSDAIAGVSQTTYLDGCRFPYWVVTLRLATPQELVDDGTLYDAQVSTAWHHESRGERSERYYLGLALPNYFEVADVYRVGQVIRSEGIVGDGGAFFFKPLLYTRLGVASRNAREYGLESSTRYTLSALRDLDVSRSG